MTFDDIVGQSSHLADEMRSGRIVHAYLFAGPAGTGKRTLAAICAAALLCGGEARVRPCGQCPACRRFESENHPDVLRVRPEKSIGVDALRALLDALAARPYEGGRRPVLIYEADKMTAQAQNALLKTLEEPPAGTVFFLITDAPAALLPTIRSRARMIRFAPLPVEQATDVLIARGIERERAQLLARLAQGTVGRALAMDGSEAYWKMREQVIGALTSLRGAPDVALAAAPLKAERPQAEEMLAVMELWARDLMALQNGAPSEIMQVDRAATLARQEIQGDAMLAALMEARKRLASNVSWQSVVEMLFYEITGGYGHGDSSRNSL